MGPLDYCHGPGFWVCGLNSYSLFIVPVGSSFDCVCYNSMLFICFRSIGFLGRYKVVEPLPALF